MSTLGKCSWFFPILAIFGLLLSDGPTEVESRWNGWTGNLDWWQETIIYQIYPSSFQDSDGDGLGDLNGITSRIDHFVDAGIKTFWMSPIFKSPMIDMGYDISNFTDVDPIFGTLDDFRRLMKAAKDRGMHVMLDFVPNHSSDEHEWFQKSLKKIEPYTDYYVWHDGIVGPDGKRRPPNNWLSLFGGSGWTYREERNQYYYHFFHDKQPDLNFRSEHVKREMEDVMKFWLDLGVDGFRIDAVEHLYEHQSLENETMVNPNGSWNDYYNRYHNLTSNQPETYNLVCAWRQFLRDYAAKQPQDKHTRIIATEVYGRNRWTQGYYGNGTHQGAQVPFNFNLVFLNYESNATVYNRVIKGWVDNMPDGEWPNWVLGNHDCVRVAARLGREMVDAFNMLSMLLPGVSITYQGEEIGQDETLLRQDQLVDRNFVQGGRIVSRDPRRGPFLWDNSENAGFTSRKRSWSPIHPSYWHLNLETQKKDVNSHYNIYKQISNLRKHPTIQRGTLKTYVIATWIFAIVRELPGHESIIVVFNLGSEREVIILSEGIPNLPETVTVLISSQYSGYSAGKTIHTTVAETGNSTVLILRPKAAVVLKSNGSTESPPLLTTQGPDHQHHNNSAFTLSSVSKPLLLLGATLPILINNIGR